MLRSRSSSVFDTAIPMGGIAERPPGARYNIFETLQHNLPEWLDRNCTTKTALVFG